jgi:hypothetical protein
MGLRSWSRHFASLFVNAHEDLLVEQYLLLEEIFGLEFVSLMVVPFITELDLLTRLVF